MGYVTTIMEIGDMRLENTGNGSVDVYRNGEYVGEVLAQALHEAAELPDERLSEAWVEFKER